MNGQTQVFARIQAVGDQFHRLKCHTYGFKLNTNRAKVTGLSKTISAPPQCQSIQPQSDPIPMRLCEHVYSARPNNHGKKAEWDFLVDSVASLKKTQICESLGCCFVQTESDKPFKCVMPSTPLRSGPITTQYDTYHKVKAHKFDFHHTYRQYIQVLDNFNEQREIHIKHSNYESRNLEQTLTHLNVIDDLIGQPIVYGP